MLDRDDPPMLSCILSESCVRRIVSSERVMAEQLRHLVVGARTAPAVPGGSRPFDDEAPTGVIAQRFTMVRLQIQGDGPPLGFIALARTSTTPPTSTRPHPDGAYEALWGTMQAAALSPTETRRRLRELARQLTEGPPDVPN